MTYKAGRDRPLLELVPDKADVLMLRVTRTA